MLQWKQISEIYSLIATQCSTKYKVQQISRSVLSLLKWNKNGSHLPFSSPPMSTKSTFATWSLSSWKEKWTGGWKTLPGYIYKRKSQGPPSPDCKEEIWKYCKQFKKKIFWKSKSFWWDSRFATGGPPTALFVSEIWPSVFFVTGRRRNWVF